MSLDIGDSYVDAFGNIAFNGQVVKIDLVSLFPDPKDPKNTNPRLSGRIATSIAATAQLRDSLNRMFADLQKAQEENQQKANLTQETTKTSENVPAKARTK
jgi:hypothetical protein